MKSPIKSKTCLRLLFKFFAITLFLFSTFPSFAQNDKLMQKVLIEPGENRHNHSCFQTVDDIFGRINHLLSRYSLTVFY
jgi:hypothetical protein